MVSEVRMARYRWDETWISVSSMRHVPVPAAWVIAIFPARDRCGIIDYPVYETQADFDGDDCSTSFWNVVRLKTLVCR